VALFERFAGAVAGWAGRPAAFVLAFLIVIVWGITGPLFAWSDTWQLVINTGTTIVTFLMVFLIQNAQNRDGAAIQAKLDELIRALDNGRNEFIGIEHLGEKELTHDPRQARARMRQRRSFLVGLAITGLYYFSASLVFPEKPEEWPDFDDWVAKHKYQVMGGILACNVITTFAVRAIVPMPLTFARVWTDVLLLTMMAVATFARPKWLTGAMLAGMIGFYLWFASVIVMSPGAFLVVSAS
jgi:low affinity Fe/Cu permease